MRSRLRHLANLVSGNVAMVIHMACALVVTRIVVQKLGVGTYGIVSLVLSLGIIITRLGSSISSATGRYVTARVAVNDHKAASDYLSNAFGSIIVGGAAGIVGLAIYAWFSPAVHRSASVPFVATMLFSMVVAAAASVLGVGVFIREKFVLQAGIHTLSRVANAATTIALLFCTGLGVWALAWGQVAGSLVLFVGFGLSLRILLPVLSLRWRLLSAKRVLEIAMFVGWVLLAYCGSYIIRTGTMVVVRQRMSDYNLGRYALAMQIGMLLLNCLQAMLAVANPKIYREVAKTDYRKATHCVERYAYLSLCVGLPVLLCLVYEGDNLLHLWLGKSVPAGMPMLLIGTAFSALATSVGSPFGTYMTAIGQIRNLAFIIVAEGIIAVVASSFLLSGGRDRLVLVTVLPGLLAAARTCILTPLLFRRRLVFSPPAAYAKKIAELALLVLAVAGVRWLVGLKLHGGNVLTVGLRILVLFAPLGVYVIYRLFSGQRGSAPLTLTGVGQR